MLIMQFVFRSINYEYAATVLEHQPYVNPSLPVPKETNQALPVYHFSLAWTSLVLMKVTTLQHHKATRHSGQHLATAVASLGTSLHTVQLTFEFLDAMDLLADAFFVN